MMKLAVKLQIVTTTDIVRLTQDINSKYHTQCKNKWHAHFDKGIMLQKNDLRLRACAVGSGKMQKNARHTRRQRGRKQKKKRNTVLLPSICCWATAPASASLLSTRMLVGWLVSH
jgi:hypothetical protein